MLSSNEPPPDKTNKMISSKDSEQPGHPLSLIRVFAVRETKSWILRYPLSAQRRLWSDWADAQADMSLQWAHMPFCWFCHDAAQMPNSLLPWISQSQTNLSHNTAKPTKWHVRLAKTGIRLGPIWSVSVVQGKKHCILSYLWGTQPRLIRYVYVEKWRELAVNNMLSSNEPPPDKTNKMICVPSQASYQPGHPLSLIIAFAVHVKKSLILSYPLSAQRRLWSDLADAQADLRYHWAHMPFCWFCHETAKMPNSLLLWITQSQTNLSHSTAKPKKWHVRQAKTWIRLGPVWSVAVVHRKKHCVHSYL